MSYFDLFCIFPFFIKFVVNTFVYGGCAHFDAYPHHFSSDPLGVMREVGETSIYR